MVKLYHQSNIWYNYIIHQKASIKTKFDKKIDDVSMYMEDISIFVLSNNLK